MATSGDLAGQQLTYQNLEQVVRPPVPTVSRTLAAKHHIPFEAELAVVACVGTYLSVCSLVFCYLSDGAWSFGDGVYFCLVTLTTVGFGDLVPCEALRCRLVGMAFIWTNVLMVSAVHSIVGARVEREVSRIGQRLGLSQLAVHLLALSLFIGVLAAGYSNYEERSLLDGIYFSASTLSTVGYGAIAPSPGTSRLLMCPILFVGVVSVGNIASYLAEAAKKRLEAKMHYTCYDKPTRAVISIFVILGSAALGGLVFKYAGGEDWSFNEALYFSVVTMTTVGFGDFAPISTNFQKILAVLFIMVSITLLAVLFGFISAEAQTLSCEPSCSGQPLRRRMGGRFRSLFQTGLHPGPSLLLLLLHAVCGALFVAVESWSFLDSVYFTSVALTTVGYGDLTPQTEVGRMITTGLVLTGVPSTAESPTSSSMPWSRPCRAGSPAGSCGAFRNWTTETSLPSRFLHRQEPPHMRWLGGLSHGRGPLCKSIQLRMGDDVLSHWKGRRARLDCAMCSAVYRS
ncbi:TPKA [Symbiodinium natans]|uniref:TPKA protein n=1 Tax=Symbiodinium natans TaxID=878477 RepID=A0A812G2A4_9DINO|nr:TPKA [Symbiodinium natans]